MICAVIASRVPMTVPRVVLLTTLFAIMVPFFLPRMHDRYFYLADALSVVAAFYFPHRLWPVPVLVQFASYFCYVPFLFGRTEVELYWTALAMLGALILVLWEMALNLSVHRARRDTVQTLEGIR